MFKYFVYIHSLSFMSSDFFFCCLRTAVHKYLGIQLSCILNKLFFFFCNSITVAIYDLVPKMMLLQTFSMVLICIFVWQGVKIEDVSYDQDTTDLHKCVTFICDLTPKMDRSNVSCKNIIWNRCVTYIWCRWFLLDVSYNFTVYKFCILATCRCMCTIMMIRDQYDNVVNLW